MPAGQSHVFRNLRTGVAVPELVARIKADGHEVGNHYYVYQALADFRPRPSLIQCGIGSKRLPERRNGDNSSRRSGIAFGKYTQFIFCPGARKRVMRECGLLVRPRRLHARRRKEWGRVEASAPNRIWQSDMTKTWAGPAVGWAYSVSVIDCCTREIVGWNLSHRCRTEDALAAVEQAVLARLPGGSREANVTLTTDNGTQFTSSRFLETLGRLGITHRRTAYHHPEGNSYIERFHRSLKEEEVWTAEYRSLEEARASIARWIEEYNHDRPHGGVRDRTPHEAFLAFEAVLNSEALTVQF